MPLSERAPKVLAGAAELSDGTGSWSGVGSLWILILALTYFLAGLLLERRLMPVGIVLAVGYLFTLYVPEYGFTTAGVMVALALVAQAWLRTRAESIVRNQISTVVTNWNAVCDEAALSDADRRYLWRKQFLNGLAFEGLEDVLAPEIDVVGRLDPYS